MEDEVDVVAVVLCRGLQGTRGLLGNTSGMRKERQAGRQTRPTRQTDK